MEEHVHRCKPGRTVDELNPGDEVVSEMLLLGRREVLGVLGHVLIGRQQEASRPAGRVHDGVVDGRLDAVHDRRDQCSRGEVLTRPGLDVLSTLGEESLVGVTLDIDAGRRPVLLVDEVGDELLQFGRVLDLVLGLPENDSEGPRLAS